METNNTTTLLHLIREALEDDHVDSQLKHQMAKEGRAFKADEVTLEAACIHLIGLLTPMFVKHQNKIPASLKAVYQFVVEKGEKYKMLGIGIQNVDLWF